ncbi:MAG: OmpA family protein [Chitinophagaceae bacterium]|nr:OmpA family protein [Chitinophagaceae bacterium]
MKVFISILFCCIQFISRASDSTSYIIYFDFNDDRLTAENQEKLANYFNSFDYVNYKMTKIVIVGHTDQIGTSGFNYDLSIRRANSIAVFLIGLKIPRNIIMPLEGYGKDKLVTPSMEEDARVYNRRVEIITYYEKIVHTKKTNPPSVFDPPPQEIKKTPSIIKLEKQLTDSSLKVGDHVELPNIFFYGGLPVFLQISYPYLEELVYTLKKYPNIEVEIQGHVCCTNDVDGIDNSTGKRNLSEVRAKAVYDYLVEHGIDKKRMQHKGYGHQFPITLERTESERTRNRRVELKILKK